jgi:hypothetical protein
MIVKKTINSDFRRKIIIRILISLLILIVVLLGVSFFFYDSSLIFPTTGNAVLTSYSGTGYASPIGKFTISPDGSSVISLNPSNPLVNLNVKVTEPGGYVYAIFYVFNYRLNKWVPFAFPQATVDNSNWIADSAEVDISLNATNNLINNNIGPNYVVTYSCKKDANLWKCGYESPTVNNQWMLHKFDVSGIISPASITPNSCVSNADCGSGNCTGHVCVNGIASSTVDLTSCRSLDQPGVTYVLKNNVVCTEPSCDTCFYITADNIILDGNGFSIDYITIGNYTPDYSASDSNGLIVNYLGNDVVNSFTLNNARLDGFSVPEDLTKLSISNSTFNYITLNEDARINEINAKNIITSGDLVARRINLTNSVISGTYLIANGKDDVDYIDDGEAGGEIYLKNTSAGSLRANGGYGNNGGRGGNIILIDSNVGDIGANGGSGYSGGGGGFGGSLELVGSNVSNNIYANGGWGTRAGGNGGNIVLNGFSSENEFVECSVNDIFAVGGFGDTYFGGNGGRVDIYNSFKYINSINVNGGDIGIADLYESVGAGGYVYIYTPCTFASYGGPFLCSSGSYFSEGAYQTNPSFDGSCSIACTNV